MPLGAKTEAEDEKMEDLLPEQTSTLARGPAPTDDW